MANLGAITIAEGNTRFKTDVTLALNNERNMRNHILRTTYDELSVWKAKYANSNISPFEGQHKSVAKEAALIDGEIWVFGVNATRAADIVAAIHIAAKFYKIKAEDILRDIYVKNLNVEGENSMGNQALVQANKGLYTGVCTALVEAARHLNVTGQLNFWVISNNANPKIPQGELHQSLRDGGATAVVTDQQSHIYVSGSNDGLAQLKLKTNLHLATLKV